MTDTIEQTSSLYLTEACWLPPPGQASPLPIRSVGKPHLLEVSYPSDVSQDLAISIVEPNAAGMVVPIGLDSGV